MQDGYNCLMYVSKSNDVNLVNEVLVSGHLNYDQAGNPKYDDIDKKVNYSYCLVVTSLIAHYPCRFGHSKGVC